MTVQGDGQIIRNPAGETSDCCPVTARFVAGTTCGPQVIGGDDLATALWLPPSDPFNEWDDIGFPSDYSTTGSFFFGSGMDGEYLVNIYVSVADMGPVTLGDGWVLVNIVTGQPPDEKLIIAMPKSHDSDHVIPIGPRRFYSGQDFRVDVITSEGSSAGVLIGVIGIVKLKSLPPL